MIESPGATLLSSLALVGMLGFRHGFDADHIAVVDGMTRARQLHKSYWTSRLVGAQSLVRFRHDAPDGLGTTGRLCGVRLP